MMLQTLVNGILLGGLYACIGVAFSLLYGVMNLLNLAHGSLIMIGGYISVFAFQRLGVDPFLSLPLSMVCLFIIGYLIQRIIINRVVDANIFMVMILTFGVDLILVNVALLLWSADYRTLNTPYSSLNFQAGPVVVPVVRLAVFCAAVLLTVALALFMRFTGTGQAIQATALDRYAARLIGIDVMQIYALTFGISAALAGAAGTLLAMIMPIYPEFGGPLTLKAFIVAVLGGLGGLYGALIGGVLLGVVELAGAYVIGPSYQVGIGVAMLLAVLIFRPQGILGKRFFSEVTISD
jgi:branched-chain amino acid transport system permease protein